MSPGAAHLRRAAATRRNSARRFSRPTGSRIGQDRKLGRQALAALATTITDHAAATDRGHAGAEAVTTGADQLAGLISTFHGFNSENQETAV
jgi:hypothetical protein